MEQSRRRRHAHQTSDLGAAARLTVDHNSVRVAAEIGDILVDPAKRSDQGGASDVDRVGICRSSDFGEVEEPQYVETMVYRHLHDVVIAGHLRAFMRGQFIGRAEGEAAAMEV